MNVDNKKMHQIFWNEIADIIMDKDTFIEICDSIYGASVKMLKFKKLAYKRMISEYQEVFEAETPMNYCYACEETLKRGRKASKEVADCNYCPIQWGKIDNTCDSLHSPYTAFNMLLCEDMELIDDVDEYQERLHNLAKVIANMKWNEDI